MEEEGDKEVNEEGNVTLAGSAESRWVDGSEFDSGSPTLSLLDNEEMRQGFGSVRRRLVKKAKRVDSFDVEAMEIAGANGHDSKPASGIGNQWQDEETMNLVQENKKLRAQLLELENSEKQLDLKVKQLKGELEDVQHEYKRLLAESEAINMIKEEKT